MGISDLIEDRYDRIIADWAAEARKMHSSARALPGLALIDHIPELLRDLIAWLRRGGEQQEEAYDTSAVKHAIERLAQDVDLREVVDEYRILRAVVQKHALAEEPPMNVHEVYRLNAAIDAAIAVSVYSYSERRERENRHETARLRVALSASKLGAWEWHPSSNEAIWDDRLRAILGLPADAPASPEVFYALLSPTERAALERSIREQLEAGDDFEVESELEVDGETRWVRSVGTVIGRDSARRPLRVIGTTMDVTAMKRALLRENLAKRELEAFARIGAALVEQRTFDDFLSELLALFMQSSSDVETATLLLYEDDLCSERRLRVRASMGLGGESRCGRTIAHGKGFAGTIAATRSPLLLNDAAHSDLVISDWIRESGIRALYGVPLLASGELVGVAHIGSRTVTDFAEDEKRLFAAVADRAASAIAQATLRDQLARKNAQLEAVMEAVPDALFVADQERVLFVNGAARAFGLEPSSVVCRGLADVGRQARARRAGDGGPIPPESLPLVRAARGEHTVEHIVGTNAEGQEMHARVAAAPVTVGSSIVGAVSIWTDITPVVELERQRDAFMHAAVHDLRNPLHSIVTTAHVVAQRISKSSADPWAIDRIQRIAQNALRLDRLLNDLLDVTLAKSGRIEIKRDRVRLRDLLEEQATIWSAASPNHRLVVAPCDVEVLADHDRVIQILDNLLSNAIKYSPAGGPVELSCSRQGGEAVISVRDHGMGIAPEEQQRIFDAYTRARHSAWAAGHGLGLFITSELVRLHGGRMGVRSGLGEGAEFWFTLPLADADSVHIH